MGGALLRRPDVGPPFPMRFERVARKIDELHQLLVRGTRLIEVVSLDGILLDDFPVGGDRNVDLLEQRQSIEVRNETAYFRLGAGRHRSHGLRRGIEIDEYEGCEHRNLDRLQAMRGPVEAGNALGVRSAAKTAVESVCPGMVAAGQHGCLAAPRLDQPIAPMLANVVKRAQFTVAPREDAYALFENMVRHEVSRFSPCIAMPDHVP